MTWTRALLIVMAVLLTLVSARLWLSRDGMPEVWRLEEAIERQQAENDALVERNAALDAEVRDLRDGLDAVEERARTELGMTGPGETFIQIVEDERPAPDGG